MKRQNTIKSRKTIETIFRIFEKNNPHPQGELYYTNIYTLLVAVVLSAQATDKGVNKATKELFKKVATPEDMISLGMEALIEHIKSIGLYRSKASHIMSLSGDLLEFHGGAVPKTREELMRLAGVGRKTANVVLNIAFGEPTIAVDTHIFRLANRIGLVAGRTPLEVEEGLSKIVPSWAMRHCHHWLILHGRYICKARMPLCGQCPIFAECLWENKNDAH